eukprot:CAMPEP_0172021980 /NCGR_PEP_ID=MMETSP1041-20130122/14014_1 /TAXON_ID=464988 /ORGANISM="Hemiselmis andersenii, Strain CCMP439" /LENGTH=329 /DNA_ID=CAMNT_0012677367 /DNA_START=58 /DNA_END=1047 /DNA_ORIENTATION=-
MERGCASMRRFCAASAAQVCRGGGTGTKTAVQGMGATRLRAVLPVVIDASDNNDETIWPVVPEGEFEEGSHFATGLWSASDKRMDLRKKSVEESERVVYTESIEGVAGAVMLHKVLTDSECEEVVKLTEEFGYKEYNLTKNTHATVTWVASREAVVNPLYERIKESLPRVLPSRDFKSERQITGLNGRLRCYRYQPDGAQTFRKHLDDSFYSSGIDKPGGNKMLWDDCDGTSTSVLTFLLYLTDDFEGGCTVFHPGTRELGGSTGVKQPVAVRPVKGSVLCFYQTQRLGSDDEDNSFELAPLHEGSVLTRKEGVEEGGGGEGGKVCDSV